MENGERKVPLEEAMAQVRTVGVRLALMHLAYARTLVAEHGPQKGRDLIVKAMMAYGKLVGERNLAGGQDLPWYGFHDAYVLNDTTYTDTREQPAKGFDWAAFKVFGCILAKTFLECGEPELGKLYCYVDAAKSMAADPSCKLIHTACEVCGDDFCAFDRVPTTAADREHFAAQDPGWKASDPILLDDEPEDG